MFKALFCYLKIVNDFKFSIIVSRNKTNKHVNHEDYVHYHIENIIFFCVDFRESKGVGSDSTSCEDHSKSRLKSLKLHGNEEVPNLIELVFRVNHTISSLGLIIANNKALLTSLLSHHDSLLFGENFGGCFVSVLLEFIIFSVFFLIRR